MKTVEEYQKNAADCREIAKRTALPEHRAKLEDMARAWETLAIKRTRALARDDGRERRELP